MLSSRTAQSTCAHSTSRVAAAAPFAPLSVVASRQAVQRLSQQQLSSWQPAAAWQQRALVQLPRALKDEEAELDRITKEAAQSDIWGSEVVGNAVKVGIVAGVLAVVVLLANLIQPMFENTIKSFPTPAGYELYEQREGSAGSGGF